MVRKNLSVTSKKAKTWLKRKGVNMNEYKRIKEDDSQAEGAGKNTRVYFGIKKNEQETEEEGNDIEPVASTEQEQPQSEEKKEEYINICNDLDQM